MLQKAVVKFRILLATALVLAACSPQVEQALPPEAHGHTAPVDRTPAAAPETQSITAPQIAPISEAQSMAAPQTTAKPAAPLRRPALPIQRCINLGNALESPVEGEWGYSIRARDFTAIARAGFDTVRIPIRWDPHMQTRAPYRIDAAFMARTAQVVKQAQEAGLGVIIDVHHYEDLIRQPKRHEARYLALWDQIADYYKSAPSTVYFELLNEPTKDISMRAVNRLYAKVIPRIRKTNPTRKLIFGGNWWNSVESLGEVNWPQDRNIIATFHDYGPHEFTHQGASWTDPGYPVGRVWGQPGDAQEFLETYNLAAQFQAKTGLPVLVGEFGVIDTVPARQRNQWLAARRSAMEAAGYGWCVWDFAGAFSLYDMDNERWRPGAIRALIP